MHFHTTKVSRNEKTGPMPVMTSSADTCPTSCPFREKGCYAMTGPLKLHWDKVTSGERGSSLDDALKPIRKLNRGAFWRYGQAGDLPGPGDTIDREAVRKITAANRGKNAIIFTHKPPTESNLEILKEAKAGGLTINLSADTLQEADELANTGLPVVVVLPQAYARLKKAGRWAETITEFKRRLAMLRRKTEQGRKVALCPATYLDVSCTQCGICSNGNRKGVVVGFPAHGTNKNYVSIIASSG